MAKNQNKDERVATEIINSKDRTFTACDIIRIYMNNLIA